MKLQDNLRAKTEEFLSSAVVDSHRPIEYNPGKQMFLRFHELYITPIMRQFGLASARKEKPV
jgi:hypothetical protein